MSLESPLVSFLTGHFNAKCSTWWNGGIDNLCGLELYDLTKMLGFTQLIRELTNFEPNKHPSCIDLIFTSQPNLVLESEVKPTLSTMCHHQIIYENVALKVHVPPSYYREVWHYDRANIDMIKSSIENFDWNGNFIYLDVNEQVELLNNYPFKHFQKFYPA